MPTPRFIMTAVMLCTICWGCGQPASSNSNTNGNDNSSTSTQVILPLGDAGRFGEGLSSGLQDSKSFDVSDLVPQGDVGEIRLSIDAADIAIGTAYDADTSGMGSVVVLVYFAPPENETPCTENTTVHFFDVAFENDIITSVSPESEVISDAEEMSLLQSGVFGLCFIATSERDVAFSTENLRLTFVPPGDVVATNCTEVRSLTEVQAAISDLAVAGITFDPPTGSNPPDVEGSYTLDETTTRDNDGDNTGDTLTGTITLANQSGSSIQRTGFGASVDQFISGNATSVGFCTLARTNDSSCDQTIARLESLAYDATTGDMTGHFLAVVVQQHASTSATCGDAGAYIYGDISLTAPTTKLAELRGKVELEADFTPDLLIVPGDGGDATVTDFDGPNVLHFTTQSPFDTTPLVLPDTLSPLSFSSLGLSRDDARLAVVTHDPDAAVIYDNATGSMNHATATTDYDYIGDPVDFNLDGTRLYVPSTSTEFADRITVLRTEDSTFDDIVYKLNTPQGKVPVQARISPDGEQIAVLLEGGAPIGEAAELTFGNPTNGNFLTPTIDLETDAGGTVLASELLYSSDGSRVFLAGLGAVVAVETQSPYAITRIDVSSGAEDNPIALAMSGDGKVLAVAIDDANGSADFAVVDTATLAVLNMQDLPGIGTRRVLDVAHFENVRVAMVANLESTVVAVQTVSPYAAGTPILVADVADKNALGRIEAGGSTIAVTNIEEPAIYIFQPKTN